MPRVLRILLPLTSVLLIAVPQPARAACLLVGPPEAFDEARLEAQYAVIDVRRSGVVDVDVCLSLSDEADEPRELSLVVPFTVAPQGFEMKGADAADFLHERIYPLDQETFVLANNRRIRFLDAALLGGLAGGPSALGCALALADRLAIHPKSSWSLSPVEPPTAVECVGCELFEALDADELARALGAAELPERIVTALQPYAARPFALLTLRTLPDTAEQPARYWHYDEAPGIRLSFRHEMIEENGEASYAYPLGVGRGWRHAVGVTTVFVTAQDELAISPQFRPPPQRVSMSSSLAWSTANHGRDLHVYHLGLLNSRSEDDLVVRTAGEGTAARRSEQQRLLLARVLFPLAGAAIWLLMFRLLVWPAAAARKMGWLRAVVKSWGVPYLLVLGPMYIFMYDSGIDPDVTPSNVGLARFFSEVWTDAASLVCFLLFCLALVLTFAMVRWVAKVLVHKERETIGLSARALLAALLAGPIYLALALQLGPWLSR